MRNASQALVRMDRNTGWNGNCGCMFCKSVRACLLFVSGNTTGLSIGLTPSWPVFLSDLQSVLWLACLEDFTQLTQLVAIWGFVYLTSIAPSLGDSSSQALCLPQIMFRKGFLPGSRQEHITCPGQLLSFIGMRRIATFRSTTVRIYSGGRIRLQWSWQIPIAEWHLSCCNVCPWFNALLPVTFLPYKIKKFI